MKTYRKMLLVSIFGNEPPTEAQMVYGITDDDRVVSIPFDDGNTDYKDYLAWLAEGNTPNPAEES